MKYEIYQNPNGLEVFEWIKEAEQELHPNAKAVYNCVLANFGGSHQITARLVDPEGGMVLKIKTRINKKLAPRRIKWFYLTIGSMFVTLCLHIFDYVKDVGETITILFIRTAD